VRAGVPPVSAVNATRTNGYGTSASEITPLVNAAGTESAVPISDHVVPLSQEACSLIDPAVVPATPAATACTPIIVQSLMSMASEFVEVFDISVSASKFLVKIG